jgi:hypothetical protein
MAQKKKHCSSICIIGLPIAWRVWWRLWIEPRCHLAGWSCYGFPQSKILNTILAFRACQSTHFIHITAELSVTSLSCAALVTNGTKGRGKSHIMGSTEVLSKWLFILWLLRKASSAFMYILKQRVWCNAAPHIRKSPHNRRLSPTVSEILGSCWLIICYWLLESVAVSVFIVGAAGFSCALVTNEHWTRDHMSEACNIHQEGCTTLQP